MERVAAMPRTTIRTGFVRDDGTDVVLEEFLCDWPDCPNVAEHVLGALVELRTMAILCSMHMAELQERGRCAD
jgi:hypothetical protein